MPDRLQVQSNRIPEYPEIWKEEDELRLDSWIKVRSSGWREIKWRSLAFLENLEHTIEEP